MLDSLIYGQSDDNTSSDESFCLQMKVQTKQADTNVPANQHLFTNLEVKVKPHKNKTKFLHARLDTCADVNILPCSVYQLLFKDPDCTKLAHSDLQLGTYTNNKVKLIDTFELYVIHPNTKSIEAVMFFVACNEGSVLLLCTTSLALGMIKPHARLDHLPSGSNVISSSADQPIKDTSHLNVHMLMETSKTSQLTTRAKKISAVCSKKEQCFTKCSTREQSHSVLKLKYHVNQCVKDKVPVQDETRKWECPANVKEGDKNCQVNVQPVKPEMYIQSKEPAKLQSGYKKKIK